MDELSAAGLVDPDELMDLDDAEPSDVDDDDNEHEHDDDPQEELLQLNSSSGPASAATSAASSPPTANDDCGPPAFFSGKPLSIKRGRGRPRREGGKPFPRRNTVTGVGGVRMKKWKPGSGNNMRGTPKRVKSFDRSDCSDVMMSSADEMILDPETGALVPAERVQQFQEELPYAPEAWPGKVCGFCNLGERSQLGQGELLRLTCPDGFTPERIATEQSSVPSSVTSTPEHPGDKSPRGPVTCRRQKSFNKCRNPSMTSEYIDELTIIGYVDPPEVQSIFEPSGHFYVHRSCTHWSNEVTRTEHMGFDNVGPSLLLSISRKCMFCNHYGASAMCKMEGCTRTFHFPCATASGAFQELSSCMLYCNLHLSQVVLKCENSVCYTCKTLGDVANLMYCSMCGEHYHGACVGLAQHPGVRAGWQCRKCRICQTCRLTGDETKLLTCEQCEKVYHALCQRPIVASIPKYGWKCRCCRVCGDCGSRTPGAGLSSRWHAHYTVCDSCYQQRNKGFNCPICHRAYRAHAHREMVQCSTCRKFVHGTCDGEADLVAYHQRKEAHPEYDYVCLTCKNMTQGNRMLGKRNSIDEDSMSASQESLYDDTSEFDMPYGPDEGFRSMGLGKGKPYACKIAKKRLGYGPGYPGRPKGGGKLMPGKVGFMKRQRMTEFGRKRGAKYKMRGVFGVPGVGLQRPTSDGTKDEEPGIENRLVLCSAKDKYILTQDICVMCGAIGTDQEGCLIACVQCGQCYHPYCVNVKVTKVILQTGWRCLDCTVCEGCGQRDDENRLVLCDDCDISFHIYCMDPPLNYVPHGNWKCKWCALCQTCGATDPGFNCNWMNSYTECGPCASHTSCPSCQETYGDGELIIQCTQCERWLHGACDSIKNELDAEKCAEDGYTCLLCRPRDVQPPHLVPILAPKPPTPTKSPEVKTNSNYIVDGVLLSESGHNLIKSLCSEHSATRKKRKKPEKLVQHNKEAGIMATIESVIAGVGAGENSLDAKLELVDIKDEHDLYKEGMTWTKDDGPPPEGFTLFTGESGITVLRRKRQRNLQKLGIGGFLVRVRGIRGQDNDEVDMLPGQTTPTDPLGPPTMMEGDKPRRKPIRRKIKSKLSETFPVYLQDAFFGRDLLDSQKELGSGESSDDEKDKSTLEKDKIIHLSQDEVRAVATAKEKNPVSKTTPMVPAGNQQKPKMMPTPAVAPTPPTIVPKEEEESDTDPLTQFELPDILDTDFVDTIMNGGDAPAKTGDIQALVEGDGGHMPLANKDTKDEFSDIFNLDIPNMNTKDVEDILFKGVLTDESQESQESSIFPLAASNVFSPTGAPTPAPAVQPQSAIPPNVRPTSLTANNMNSPVSFTPQSPYQSDFSNSPQFSPYCEPPSPWVNANETVASGNNEMDTTANVPTTYNQRSSEKMKADEALGLSATISAVLYANTNHPEWKTEYPVWSDRYKQIIKKWRTLSNEAKAPFLQRAKDNRSAQRMKKAQQISKESSGAGAAAKAPVTASAAAAAVAAVSGPMVASPVHAAPSQPPTVSEEQEKMTNQQKSAREAEQERQWKNLQAIRQQQNQAQQHVLQEHRVQAIVRVQRQLSEGNQHFMQPDGMQPPQSDGILHSDNFQQAPPQVVRSLSADPYAHQPATPRPNVVQRPLPVSGGFQQKPEAESNRQLRDLLQRQQFKKLDDQLLAGKGQQRVWPPNAETPDTDQQQPVAVASEATFRQPLPPAFSKQRVPVQTIRQPIGNQHRLQLDPRLHGMDPRMRHILQQPQQLQRGPVPGSVPVVSQQQYQQTPHVQPQQRFAAPQQMQPIRHASAEIDQLLIRHAAGNQFQGQGQIRPNQVPNPILVQQPQQTPKMLPQPSNPQHMQSQTTEPPGEHEIPDNVTAELEKLEQESSSMVELQGVGDILGLGDDEDELLAEMGPDFNILEYADPELDALDGEKTNILDSLDLVDTAEPEKDDKKDKVPIVKATQPNPQPPPQTPQQQQQQQEAVRSIENQLQAPLQGPPIPVQVQQMQQPPQMPKMQPPPLVATQQTQQILQQHVPMQTQPQQQPQHMIPPQINHQLIHQQMLQQVRQYAARGQPMSQGSTIMSQDGVIGTISANNSIILSYNPNHPQLQTQKLLRMNQNPRMAAPAGVVQGQQVPRTIVQQQPQVVAPPPPPYPGPPPPYPGNGGQQMGGPLLRQGVHHGRVRLPFMHAPRRSALLLEEQPLLIQELLEQEKREQEKQLQSQGAEVSSTSGLPGTVLLSDNDFENLLKNDFESNSDPMLGNIPVAGQNMLQRGNFGAQNPQPVVQQQQWQPQPNRMQAAPPMQPQMPPQPEVTRVPQYQGVSLQAPPLPPENIITEVDKQSLLVYERWLQMQNNHLSQQLKFYDTEVQALRKVRKSLNSKQRQCKKTGGQLSDADALELQRTNTQITALQKQLENSRKQLKQHGLLMQDYNNKKQSKQVGQPSPLAPPSSSPIHPPQSPMMSPSASQSPMMQHNSPMHSPAPSVSHSPGPGSVSSVLQSPNMSQVMSPMQPSRIGTPHSQNEGSPGPVPSPLMHLPPPQMRMTSPQHRRVVTSPIGYTDMRPGGQQRFARPQLDRVRLPAGQGSPSNYQSKPGTPSPLNSPPPQQMNQQLLQRHLQQQAFFQHQQQQQQQQPQQDVSQEGVNSPKIAQLIHQRQLIRGQMPAQGQQITQQQHQMMLQQQQQLKQQQAQLQQRLQQQMQQPPNSPMPPQSPLLNQQIMSPHSMTSQPPSPMPPRSPMVQFNHPPNSPMPKSPAIHNQPPSSPMIHQPPSPMPRSPMVRRPASSSNSPATENPRTPYNALTDPNIPDNDMSGGGNPHNAPIPTPPSFGRFGYIKLGLRGGSPMWGAGYGRGAKKVPGAEPQDEKPTSSADTISNSSPKFKKESHLSKVSILKKKSPAKVQLSLTKVTASSLVSQEYNEFEDSSSPPQMQHSPSMASTSRLIRTTGKKLPDDEDILMMVTDKSLPNDIMEFDDIDISTVVSTEVSLNSAAQQNDGDDISMIHSFHTQDISEDMSSPLDNLEADQMPDEYMLFDIAGNAGDSETMQYVLQSPTTSDEAEYQLQGSLQDEQTGDAELNAMLVHEELQDAEAESESGADGENEEITMETSEGATEDSLEEEPFEMLENKDQISTKEDFEELIDERSKGSEVLKLDTQHINEIHKYAANMVYTPIKTTGSIIQAVNVRPNLVSIKGTTSKMIITAPLVGNQLTSGAAAKKDIILTTQGYKTPATMPTVLLKSNTVRNNIISVPKLVTSVSPAITIVSASTSQIASILPSRFTVPVISASAISKLPNVKVIDKPSSSLSLATPQDTSLPKKIFEDDSVSPDSSNTEDEKKDDSPDTPTKEVEVKDEVDERIEEERTAAVDDVKASTPEQVKQETKSEIQFVMQDPADNHTDDHKSVVISIPSPTPSQEQMMDNIALQALENQRSGGNGIPGEFDSFDDVLNMIENIGKSVEEVDTTNTENDKLDAKEEINIVVPSTTNISNPETNVKEEPVFAQTTTQVTTITPPNPTTVLSTLSSTRSTSTMAQLSPLSQPTEVTNNIANVSEQLRTLLTNAMHTVNSDTVAKPQEKMSVVVSSIKSETFTTPITSSVLANAIIVKNVSSPKRVSSPVVSTTLGQALQTPPPSMQLSLLNSNQVESSQQTLSKILLGVKSTESKDVPPIESPSVSSTSSIASPKVIQKTMTTNNISQLLQNTAAIQTQAQPPQVSQVPTTQTANALPLLSQQVVPSLPQPTQPQQKKPSLSLNAMLQSHPAATVPQTSPGTITTASILGSSIALTRPSLASLAQAKPHVVSPISTVSATTNNMHTIVTSSTTNVLSNCGTSAFARTPTNLLHTQLTKTTVVRPKTENEDKDKLEKATVEEQSITAASLLKHEVSKVVPSQNVTSSTLPTNLGSMTSPSLVTSTPNRMEDSQNVLLKQLLQNTACASTQSATPASTVTVSTNSGPSLPLVPNLAAQLARPVPPTPTSLLPPILQNDAHNTPSSNTTVASISSTTVTSSATNRVKTPIMSRETSFVSKPMAQPNPPPIQPLMQSQQPPQQHQLINQQLQPHTQHVHQQPQQLHIDIKKGLPPSRTPSRDDLLSPATPRSTGSQDSSLQTPPLVVKKELTSQSPVMIAQEVKKELLDESSQHSEISDHSKSDVIMKEEMDDSAEKTILDKEELKKQKRRMYQQKRRQNQILNKEAAGQQSGQPKKRSRKSSKVDEDYDSYIESVLAQLRTLPSMIVAEPVLSKNFAVVPVYGSGDQSKLGTKEFDPRVGDLVGTYGNAIVPGFADFYNSQPYGDQEQLPEKPPTSTQRGFYDQEFPLIRFDNDDDKKWELFARDDTPDSVVCSSSPEIFEEPKKFMGLRLIEQEQSDPSEQLDKNRLSPIIPIIAPVPIRLKPTSLHLKDYPNLDKENICNLPGSAKSKFGTPGAGTTPLKDAGNVTVTLTLTSSAAEDIMGVLRDLANILHIPAPTSYQIVERTGTPPSQKLGLYRTKGKDGKEGAPIDIQSILNGDAKFCRHCDVVILNNMIRKKVSELPFLSKDSELLSDGDEIYFCSSSCYMQLALMHRSPSISEDRAAALIKHLCQKEDKKKMGQDILKISDSVRPEKMELDFSSPLKEKPVTIKTEDDPDAMQVDDEDTKVVQKWKDVKYKVFSPNCVQPANKYKKLTDKEIMELMYRLRVTVMPTKIPDDTRKCMFCNGMSDAVADGPARLLNFDVDKWVHLNCGLWSDGVYETVNGALMNLPAALQSSLVSTCVHCNQFGATIRCFKPRCSNIYHLPCAVKDNCVFYKNKSTFCSAHVPKNEKDNELTTLSVSRRVYVDRDENRQVAAVMHHSDQTNLLRVGSLIFLSVGQLLPHQLANFHTANYIYPIGYKIIRFYWSMRRLNKRCRYICSIHEMSGRPEFRILMQEPSEEDQEFRDTSCKAVWLKVLEPLAQLRRDNQCVQLFTQFVSGEDLFGLSEPAVVRVLESLPGIETLTDYKFKYGRNPLLELPLAINPSGAARTEPRLRNQMHWKRPHTQRTGNSARPVFAPATATQPAGEAACPYSKQFVHSKSSQYKKMKQEWRNNVFLARSKIQGLGLYAARDLEKHTMVIEYIGEIIRSELSETREKFYDAKNRGIYMFRLDEERVVDATLCGGLARYINHSCNPNCVAEIVEVDRDLRIIIFAKRRIQRGEELAYDYKFDIEDDQHKISCMCGAPNCKKWMN